jgi:hypothetical protein
MIMYEQVSCSRIKMDVRKTACILVAPPETIETKLIKEAAAILQKDPYDARLLLTGKIPKIIAKYPTIEEAESIAKQLVALGLTAIVVYDQKPGESPITRLVAHGLQFGEGTVTFRDKGNQLVKMETKDVFLILKGRFSISAEKAVTTTKMKLNLSATLMTGGLPVFKKVQETTGKTSVEMGYFVRIYERLSEEPRVEFFENTFDFSSLGQDIAPSSSTNINTIIAKLRALFPGIIYDDRLTQPSVINRDIDRQTHDIELNCRYLYLYYQSVQRPG